MRKLQLKDAFSFGRILKNVNIKTILVNANQKLKEENSDRQEIFLDVMLSIIYDACDENVEREIYTFLGDIVGKDAESMSQTALTEVIDDLKAISKENNLESFFDIALKITN